MSASASDDSKDGENGFVRVHYDDSLNQESNSSQADRVDRDNEALLAEAETVHDDLNDVKVSEDGGKEDMFVDCPDELISFEGRNAAVDNTEAIDISGIQQLVEEKDDTMETRLKESENQPHIREKEGFASDYEEERRSVIKEIANFRHLLKALNEQKSLVNDNDGGSVDLLDNSKIEGGEKELPVMINECSKLIEHALDERSRTEGTIRELHSILSLKDQEIENLNSRVNEFSGLHDVEASANRLLTSLANVIYQEELLDESLTGKLYHIEKSTLVLIENYNQFLYESDLLRQSLAWDRSDVGGQTVFLTAREELLELKRKEVELSQKISHLEDENGKLLEQINIERETVEKQNAEIRKLREEVEQEKNRYSNTKEKLSMAVTKGKALVHQRDSLKQSLADKTSELEKCLSELQEKSSALEAAELDKEELVKNQNWVASLQEELSQRDTIFEKFKEILSQSGPSETSESMDVVETVSWLVNERNEMAGISQEFRKLTNALSLIDLPETVMSYDFESRVSWLAESFFQAKDEATKLQDEIDRTKEAADNEIGLLTTSLLEETQEKNYLRDEFEELTRKFEEIVEKENQVTLEKDRMVNVLLEVSGIAMDGQEEAYQPNSDTGMIIDRCIGKIKEQTRTIVESPQVDMEVFEKIQGLLYLRDQESMLYEKILEEEMVERSEVNRLSNELVLVSQELSALKDEKATLQTYLERSEEKTALLREKLSMAVKKGKGLVQDRENLKQLIDEKNGVIEKLKLELQQQESVSNDYRDQINRFSTDVENLKQLMDEKNVLIEKLNLELQQHESVSNDCRDQINKLSADVENLKQLLDEKNGMIETLSIELQQLESLSNDYRDQITKLSTDIENSKQLLDEKNGIIEKLKLELEQQESVSNECGDEIKKLSTDVENLKQLLEEKNGMIEKLNLELQQRESECSDFRDQINKFSTDVKRIPNLEADLAAMKDQKDDLERYLLESNGMLQRVIESIDDITLPIDFEEPVEKVKWLKDYVSECQDAKAQVDGEVERVKDEAYAKLKSLEDALSVGESNLSQIAEEKRELEVSKACVEEELRKLIEETSSQSSKFAEICDNKKSLEDALLLAENNISILNNEKEEAQVSRAAIEMELQKMMEEVSAQSNKLSEAHKIIQSLEDQMSQVHNKVQVDRAGLDSEINKLKEEVDSQASKLLDASSTIKSLEDTISNLVGEKKTAEEEISTLNLRLNACMQELDGKHVNFENRSLELSSHLNSLQLLLKDDNMLSLLRQGFEKKIESLTDVDLLLKDVWERVGEMDSEMPQNYPLTEEGYSAPNPFPAGLDNVANMEMVNGEVNAVDGDNITLHIGKTVEGFHLRNKILADNFERSSTFMDEIIAALVEKLQATRNKMIVILENKKSLKLNMNDLKTKKQEQENKIKMLESNITNLESELSETRITCEKAIDERDINQSMVSKLETDLEALQNLCSDMRLKLQDYEAKEDNLKGREEAEDPLLSESQIKLLFDKIHGIEIPLAKFEVVDLEPHESVHVKKLFYIIDSVNELQHQLALSYRDKEQLQSTLEKRVLEIEHLNEEIEEHNRDKQDAEEMKNELFELALGLENMIQKLGGNESAGGQKSVGLTGLLPVLEKLVVAVIMESENSISKAQELGDKLLGTQKVLDELSSKVKLLEDSNQGKDASPEIREKGVFEAPSSSTRSEISEIEDAGSLGKIAISPAQSAAHVRTLRKGSTDHLAINVDAESDRLISKEETDEDKGHLFKSLNTSGLVPIQGKMIADRIDGIWVSGGRALMNRPRARLGLIAYWLFLHIWLLGTIL